jgi:hypothetical protein
MILTAALTILITAVSLVSNQTRDINSACLQVSIPDQVNQTRGEARALTYMIIDLERQSLIRALPNNDLHLKIFADIRRVEISPNGKLVAISGYGGDPAISHFGIIGNGATQPTIFKRESESFYDIEGLEFHWIPDSRTLFGWKYDQVQKAPTTLFTVDQYGNFRLRQLQDRLRLRFVRAINDGRVLLSGEGGVKIWSADTLAEVGSLDLVNPYTDYSGAAPLFWHPVRDEFAYLSIMDRTRAQLRIRTLDSEVVPPVVLANPTPDEFGNIEMSWSPDGNALLVSYGAEERKRFRLIDTKTASILYEDTVYPHFCNSTCTWPVFAWKPDSSGFYFPDEIAPSELFPTFDRGLAYYDIDAGKKFPALRWVWEYRFLPNGWLWAEGHSDGKYQVAGIRDGKMLRADIRDEGQTRTPVLFDNTQNVTLTYSGRDEPNYISWMNFDHQNSGRLPASLGDTLYAGWSPNGRYAAYRIRDDKAAIDHWWLLDTHQSTQTRINSPAQAFMNAAPSNDGLQIAFAYFDTGKAAFVIQIMGAKTGETLLTAELPSNPDLLNIAPALVPEGSFLLWSPDARYVALTTTKQLAVINIQTGKMLDFALPQLYVGAFKLRWSDCH